MGTKVQEVYAGAVPVPCDDSGLQGLPAALRRDWEVIMAGGPSLQGRVKTAEQLKRIQQRFAESAAARRVDLEQVSQSAFEELHPGRIRRD